MPYQQPSVNSLDDCECCEGIEHLTPTTLYNRPGLEALHYRVGTHGTFLETMKAALTGLELVDEDGVAHRPLDALTARDSGDFSIALLDVWATIAEILTFYQERIANEGYLPTALERRSVLELARMIGYKLRPGVAATVYLAYTVDESAGETTIPAGTRAQTVPAPGETMQSFETSEDLIARPEWNRLKLRTAQPTLAMIAPISDEERLLLLPQKLYLEGTAVVPRPNERILLAFGPTTRDADGKPKPLDLNDQATYLLARVQASQIQPVEERTYLAMQNYDSHLIEIVASPTDEGDDTGGSGPQFASIHSANITTRGTLAGTGTALISDVSFGTPSLENPYTFTSWKEKIDIAKKPKAATPANAAELQIDPNQALTADSDFVAQALSVQDDVLAQSIYNVIGSEIFPPPDDLEILRDAYVFHKKASLFGHNAPPKTRFVELLENNEPMFPRQFEVVPVPWQTDDLANTGLFEVPVSNDGSFDVRMTLDAEYEDIVPESLVVLEWSDTTSKHTALCRVIDVRNVSVAALGLTGKVTQLDLFTIKGDVWHITSQGTILDHLHTTVIHAVSEPLGDLQSGKVLADEPLPNTFSLDETSTLEIELAHVYAGLKAGRWITISGIRTDIPGGVTDSELAMLAAVEHRITVRQFVGLDAQENEVVIYEGPLPGDMRHTVLHLANPLNYTYQRDTVEINANVALATHGEAKKEVLGSGNGAQPNQHFTLKQPQYPPPPDEETVQGQLMPPAPPSGQPLTFVPATMTATGIETTLAVRVNDVLWHLLDTLAGARSADRVYTTEIDNEGKVTVTFGNGYMGARLPTGSENVRATYRVGIGKPGNVRARQISLLATRPAGVKEVINPLRATGGADPESREQARRNAPLAVRSLDRLVSVRDYADFARTFAGIGKAHAQQDDHGGVLVIVGGEDNTPITDNSSIIVNLREAFYRYGDPTVPVTLQIYEARVLVIGAEVAMHPDYRWEKTKPKVLAQLLETFDYNARNFGQDVTMSEVLAAIHGVPGVEYAQLTTLDALTEDELITLGEAPPGKDVENPQNLPVNLSSLTSRIIIEAHQLAYADPKLPDFLFLSEMVQ